MNDTSESVSHLSSKQPLGRLDLFDNLFLNVMLGLVIALLIAAKLLPWVVTPTVSPTVTPELASERLGEAPTKLYHVSALHCALHKDSSCDLKHPSFFSPILIITTKTPALHFTLWILLLLFCVKYLHEASVLRYRSIVWPSARTTGWYEFARFFSRVALLGFLYYFVIDTFIYNGGVTSWTGIILGLSVFSAYIIPDIVLARQLNIPLKLDRDWLRDVFDFSSSDHSSVVRTWLAIDLINLTLIVAILLTSIFDLTNWSISGNWVVPWLILAGCATILLRRKVIKVFSKFDSFWEIFVVLPLIIGVIFYLLKTTFLINIDKLNFINIDRVVDGPALICVILLCVNLCDWFLNAHFFFGDA